MSISHGSLSVLLATVLLPASLLTAHPQTRQRFLRQQEARASQVQSPLSTSQPACDVTLELIPSGERKPVPGNVRITAVGAEKPLELTQLVNREMGWHTFAAAETIQLPPGKYQLEMMHGMESVVESRQLDLTGKSRVRVRVTPSPLYSTRQRGLQSANTHLHLMKLTYAEMDHYLRTVPRADQLDLLFVSVLRRIPDERDYITNRFGPADVQRFARDGIPLGFGEEHRHNFGRGGEGFGHVMLLNIPELVRPVSIGPGIMRSGTDGIPLRNGILKTHRDGGTVVWCHNSFGHEDLPSWIAGLVHAQNIFDGGSRGDYRETFYRYLDLGMRVPFSTGTDWFIYDFSRVYVPLSGKPTQKRWLEQLAAGRSYITNGPFLEFQAGTHQLGDTIQIEEATQLRIRGRAVGREDYDHLELIHNGKVVHREKAIHVYGHHYEATIDIPLDIDEPGWLALRTSTEAGNNAFGKPLFSHTSPIYVKYQGRDRFLVDVARGMVEEMRASMESISQMAVFADDKEREAIMSVYRSAIAKMKERIQQGP